MSVWDLLARYVDRLDALRRFLAVAEAAERSTTVSWSRARAEARASAIVCSIAELEALVSGVLDIVNAEINVLQVQLKDIRPCLRAIAAHADWKALDGAADPAKVWARRSSVTSFDISVDPVVLPRNNDKEPIPPLDGKTIRAAQVERVAVVYGIDPAKIVSTAAVLSLRKLAAARNDVAHANLPFYGIFARAGFSTKDIRRDLDELEELGFRLVTEFDRYLVSADYLA